MQNLLTTIIIFLVIYLLFFIFVLTKEEKLEKLKKSTMSMYITKKYNLDLKKINTKIYGHIQALTTAFLVSVTFYIIEFVNNIFLKISLAIIVLVPLQLLMYMIIGNIYKGKASKQSK